MKILGGGLQGAEAGDSLPTEPEVQVQIQPGMVPDDPDDDTDLDEDDTGQEIDPSDDEGESFDDDLDDDESSTEDEDGDEPGEETPQPTQGESEIEQRVKKAEQERDALLAAILQQNKPQPVKSEGPPEESVPEQVMRLVLFGATEDQLKTVPPETLAKARKIAEGYAADEVRFALNPKARYEKVRDLVLQDMTQLLGPILQDYHTRQAQEAVNRHLNPLPPKLQERAKAIFRGLPGASSTDWGVLANTMEVAAKLAEFEALKAGQAPAQAQRVQNKATKGKIQGKAPPPASRPGKKPRVEYDGTSSLMALARQIAEAKRLR